MEDQLIEPKPRDPRALNAYRHGLTGQVLILTPEDEAAYKAHCQNIHQTLAPVGGMEVELVQEIADDRWRLKLAAALDNNIYSFGLTQPDTITAHHPEIDAAFAKTRIWLSEPKNRTLLSLYEQRIKRKEVQTTALLRQLQQERREALQQAVEEAALLSQLAASKGEAFDIQRDLPRLTHYPQFDFSKPEIARLIIHAQRLAEARKLFPKPPKPLRMAA
ncbi:MAG: hypothetical protein P4L56_17035 [Candidatus Sulfopaludibacter sp.]|nr:hypothetical protein [Candidatus Sulfopaludibacter sp.]